jgi:DNA-binding MarR family transcriptional regulator
MPRSTPNPRARAAASTPSRRSTRTKSDAAQEDARTLISADVRKILDEFQLGDVVSHLLRRAHFRAEEIFASEFAEESLTPRQKASLVILYHSPGLNQNALADRLFMDRNTVAEMVRRLVATGLIQRAPAKEDQRAYELFLAPDGARLLDRVMPRDLEVERRIAERLPPEYRPLFIKCLRLLIDPDSDK